MQIVNIFTCRNDIFFLKISPNDLQPCLKSVADHYEVFVSLQNDLFLSKIDGKKIPQIGGFSPIFDRFLEVFPGLAME